MTLVDGVDELIREAKRQLTKLSTECEQEIERATARIKEKYAHEVAKLTDDLSHLEAIKANHSSSAQPRHSSFSQKRERSRNDLRPQVKSRSAKFPVARAIREIVEGLKGHYSLDDVTKIFDKTYPGIRKTLNRTSIHRAVNLLVKSGKVEKVGLGTYTNADN